MPLPRQAVRLGLVARQMKGRSKSASGKRGAFCLPETASNKMKKRASECRFPCCCHPANNFALLQREERECLPDDAAAAAKAKAALFMTLFGLGGLEVPEAADRQTGGRAADGQSRRQTDGGTDRRSFSGGFCTSLSLPS